MEGTYADRAIYSTIRLAMLERYESPPACPNLNAVTVLSGRLTGTPCYCWSRQLCRYRAGFAVNVLTGTL
jgi:hypothetical protein